MIKSISIVLTQFFHFNELKIFRQQGYSFFMLNQQYFFVQYGNISQYDYCIFSSNKNLPGEQKIIFSKEIFQRDTSFLTVNATK